MRLNRNKSIGNVIYIVEGDKDEVDILINIYSKILNYSLCCYDKRNDIVKLINNKNKYSRVFIIPAHYSAISKLDFNDEYFNKVYSSLDRNSNRPGQIIKNINKYKNSRDNSTEMNGLFLISYPSIEAYYFNCNNKNILLTNGSEAKSLLDNINKNIDEDLLLEGVNYLINSLKEMDINLNYLDLDDFSFVNNQIFNNEEKHYITNNTYKTLSLIFISFLDLGIIDD